MFMALDRPVITCSPRYFATDDHNACIRCTVTSRPEPSSVFWAFDANITTSSSLSSPSSPSSASAAATFAGTVDDATVVGIDLQNDDASRGEIEASDTYVSSINSNSEYWSLNRVN